MSSVCANRADLSTGFLLRGREIPGLPRVARPDETNGMTETKWARVTHWTGIGGVGLFVAACVIGGWRLPGYSHVANHISEAYATGTPLGVELRFLGFIPAGILFAVFAWGARRIAPKSAVATAGFLILGFFYGLGTSVCGLFPCDLGCGRLGGRPSVSQLIHDITGLATYLTVPAGLILLGVAARGWPGGQRVARAGLVGGTVAVVGALLFLGDVRGSFAGLFQRIVESAVLLWIVIGAHYFADGARRGPEPTGLACDRR